MTVKVDKDGFLHLKDILKGTTIKPKDVGFYQLETQEDKSIVLTLFDKNEKQLFVELKAKKKVKKDSRYCGCGTKKADPEALTCNGCDCY